MPDEVVTDVLEGEIEGEGDRILRVYDKRKGDFLLSIPVSAKVTFGYFNPGKSDTSEGRYGRNDDERRTALRVYKTEKCQLAVFLGVDGFRDTSLGLTRLKQKVAIETNYEDDGLGGTDFKSKAQRALVAASEDNDLPF